MCVCRCRLSTTGGTPSEPVTAPENRCDVVCTDRPTAKRESAAEGRGGTRPGQTGRTDVHPKMPATPGSEQEQKGQIHQALQSSARLNR